MLEHSRGVRRPADVYGGGEMGERKETGIAAIRVDVDSCREADPEQ